METIGEEVKTLGRGAFGVAKLAKTVTGEMRVVKQIDLTQMGEADRETSHKEVGVLRQLKHPHIVAYFDAFLANATLFIVMEFADGGDLSNSIKERQERQEPYDESSALRIFSQCLLALQYIHGKRIVHRDIKSQNIFLMTAGDVKIGDFGISKVVSSTTAIAGTLVGTPSYFAPEICEDSPYSTKVDIWSMGVVLYELLALTLPFQASNVAALVMKIVMHEPPALPETVSEELRGIVAAALQKKAVERPTAAELLKLPAISSSVTCKEQPAVTGMAQFRKIKTLGRGAYGVALLVQQLDATGVAERVIKTVELSNLSPEATTKAREEVEVLRRLAHPHIIAYFDFFVEKETLHIVLEYADGGDLATDLKNRTTPFEEQDALRLFVQCLIALRYIHKKRILHRDIKCQNLFLTKARDVKLGDFGIAKVMQDTLAQPTVLVGTPSYLAPEMCQGTNYDGKVDIWAMGVVLYELVTLRQPFAGNNIAATIMKIVSGEPPPLPETCSEDIREVVSKALQKKPEDRPSAEELLLLPAAAGCTGAWSAMGGSLTSAGDLGDTMGDLDGAALTMTGFLEGTVVPGAPPGGTTTSLAGILQENLRGSDSPSPTPPPLATTLPQSEGSLEPLSPAKPASHTVSPTSVHAPSQVDEDEEEPVLVRLAWEAESGGCDEMRALLDEIVKLKREANLHPVTLARAAAEMWYDYPAVKQNLKLLEFDKQSDEAVALKALISALEVKQMKEEENKYLEELVNEKSHEDLLNKKPIRLTVIPQSDDGDDEPEASPQSPQVGSADGDELGRRTASPAIPSAPEGSPLPADEGEQEAECDEQVIRLLQLANKQLANEGGGSQEMLDFVNEIVRLKREEGVHPADIAKIAADLWVDPVKAKRTMVRLNIDKSSWRGEMSFEHEARQALVSALDFRLMKEEELAFHAQMHGTGMSSAPRRSSGNTLSSIGSAVAAAGNAVAAVRQLKSKGKGKGGRK